MLEALKNFCVEMLRQAGYDELADWLNDAGKKAVKVVAKVVARSIGLKGKVDKDTAKEIEEIRKSTPAKGGAVATETEEDDAIAGQYLVILSNIVAGGLAYPALVLDGFLHTDDCASFWTFDNSVKDIQLEISIDPFTKKPYITLTNSGVQIYILDKIGLEKLVDLNTKIGNNPDTEHPELATQNRPRIVNIYEHHLETVVTRTIAAPTKRNPERTKTVEEKSEIAIPGTHEGIQHLMNSLQPALVARAASAENLKNLAKDIGKKP